MTPGRLETFADGVFAIAATLLIIDVGLPEHFDDSLGRELLDIWPQYAAYAISFVTIGIMWVNHHMLIRQIERGRPSVPLPQYRATRLHRLRPVPDTDSRRVRPH